MSPWITAVYGFGNYLLKIFLGGLFNSVVQKEDDEAQHKLDAAVVQAQTANDSAKVDVQVIQDQDKIKDHYNQQTTANPQDPFNEADWNKGAD